MSDTTLLGSTLWSNLGEIIMVSALKRFAGQVAVVTASTEGIGLAIARQLALEGAKVMISSRKEENVQSAKSVLEKEGLRVEGTVCHVGKEADRKRLIEETVAKLGKINVLVSNAAVNPSFGPMLDTTTEAVWDKIMDTNVKSSFFLAKETVPHMTGSRSILFVSSIGGFVPFEMLGAYSVSKTALIGLSKVLSRELGPDGIRVNCLCPGVIKTKFSKALWEEDNIVNETLSQTALKRLGTVEDCAKAAAFLCSDDASYVTGEALVASGGMHSRL